MKMSDLFDGRVREVIVVVMRDDDRVDGRDVFDLAWWLCISFRTHEGEWRASISEDRVEEDAKPTGKFNVVTCVA